MPIRGLLDGKSVFAFRFSDDQWDELKETRRRHELLMPCCKQRATPKTSVLGNHFFAHVRRGECGAPEEPPEQLHIKSVIASAADGVDGFDTKVEWEIIDGDPAMNADVVCDPLQKDLFDIEVKEGYIFRFAFGKPSTDKLLRMTERYRDKGYSCIWLTTDAIVYRRAKDSRELSIFLLASSNVEEGAWEVVGPKMNIASFVREVLAGKLSALEEKRFNRPVQADVRLDDLHNAFRYGLPRDVKAVFVKVSCRTCGLNQYAFAGAGIMRGDHFKSFWSFRRDTVEAMKFLERLGDHAPAPMAVQKEVLSRIGKVFYWANVCNSCGTAFGFSNIPSAPQYISPTDQKILLVSVPQ